jgi:hypothetical protein
MKMLAFCSIQSKFQEAQTSLAHLGVNIRDSKRRGIVSTSSQNNPIVPPSNFYHSRRYQRIPCAEENLEQNPDIPIQPPTWRN